MICTCVGGWEIFNLRLKFHSVSSLRKEYLKKLMFSNRYWRIQVYCISVSFLVQDPGLTAPTIDFLAILRKSLDRALFFYISILEARLIGIRASISIIVHIRKFY